MCNRETDCHKRKWENQFRFNYSFNVFALFPSDSSFQQHDVPYSPIFTRSQMLRRFVSPENIHDSLSKTAISCPDYYLRCQWNYYASYLFERIENFNVSISAAKITSYRKQTSYVWNKFIIEFNCVAALLGIEKYAYKFCIFLLFYLFCTWDKKFNNISVLSLSYFCSFKSNSISVGRPALSHWIFTKDTTERQLKDAKNGTKLFRSIEMCPASNQDIYFSFVGDSFVPVTELFIP